MNAESFKEFKKVSEELIHSEDWFSFAVAEFEGPVGERINRYIFHHPGAVGVVPIEDGKIVLVRQYRPALEMEMLEIQVGQMKVLDLFLVLVVVHIVYWFLVEKTLNSV